mmetsp:Transcript_44634/g.92987  ORF Transcript_44634/g.92987 Transcript_44634/m.92987 type:complete len:268 (+) Transcript_44634:110-913(+)
MATPGGKIARNSCSCCMLQHCIYLVALALGFCVVGSAALVTPQQQRLHQHSSFHLQQPQKALPKRPAKTLFALSSRKNDDDDETRETWTFNPFDVNDLSPLDTLLRRGVVPLGIRLLRPEKYESAVVDYMLKEGCDRATAQRNMDAFFNDPNGWVVSYGRKRDLGEDFGDINAPTGVQKRPVFSFLWGSFCVWLFFVFFPTRIAELGGIQPSLPENGICRYPVKAADGSLKCEDRVRGFDEYAQEYLDKQERDTVVLPAKSNPLQGN